MRTISAYFVYLYFLVFLCAIFKREKLQPICPEMEGSFYVTLPSNVMSDEKNNTVANFKTSLAKNLFLSSDWEVALCEISYTASWYNIRTDQQIQLYDSNTTRIIIIPAGWYENITELIGYLNEVFKEPYYEMTEGPSLSLDRKSGKVTLIYGKNNAGNRVFVDFDTELSQILGFESNSLNATDHHNQKFNSYEVDETGCRPIEMRGGFYSMFVYSDIVKPSLVGDTYSQLLRVLQIPSTTVFGSQVTHVFDSPHYIPLLNTNISAVEIDIKDETGEPFPFQFGRANVILHFRQKTI